MLCRTRDLALFSAGVAPSSDGILVQSKIRGDPFITFAPRGGRGVRKVANCANGSTDRLRENANKGGGGPKSRKFCERNKWMPLNIIMNLWSIHP